MLLHRRLFSAVLFSVVVLAYSSSFHVSSAFIAMPRASFISSNNNRSASTLVTAAAATVEAPTRERTKTTRRTRNLACDTNEKEELPLEYLEDEWTTRGEDDDPFHILLLSSTFDKKRITIPYVTSCLTYVLGMPPDDASELTTLASINGMSCLGTWSREECLTLGKKLQVRDLACRVVPFCEGGMRGWQAAKDASITNNNNNHNGAFIDV